MAKQTISRGTSANDGTGTPLRTGAAIINDNFDEIYTALGDGTTITSGTFLTSSNTATVTNKTITFGNNTITGTVAQLNTAITDGTIVTTAGTEVLTNKDLTDASNSFPTTTIGSASVDVGSTVTDLPGLTSLAVDNISINGNTITTTSGDLSLTNLATPVLAKDAVNKEYVDSVAEGLAIKAPVAAATTTNLSGTYNNGASGVGATLNLGTSPILTIDGVNSWALYDGILVKDQTNSFENGRYFISQVGDSGTDWILTRCTECDEPNEVTSMFMFVLGGSVNINSGWVVIGWDSSSDVIGTNDINFEQFSGIGTYTGGEGISIDTTTFNIDYDDSTININGASQLQVKDGGITSSQLHSSVNLQVLDSTGSILKSLYGAGS